MKYRIRIARSRGALDAFEVPQERNYTILDALEWIRIHKDRTLSYRHSCHHGSCGTCGAVANGRRILTCLSKLSEFGEEISLGPLAPFPVLADLAIDPTPLYEDFPEERTYTRPSEIHPEATPPKEVAQFTRFENCIECGLCESACPVTLSFMGPAALAAFSREIDKHAAREPELLAAVSGRDGVPRCERALECSRICPLGVYPAKHIARLRRRIKSL